MKEKNLILSIIINIFITVVEIIVGLFISSLAIISDAIHNFFDVGAMILSLFSERMSVKKNNTKKTYGYKRVEILIALLNSTILLVSTGFISYEAIKRLLHPHPITGGWMLITATVAFIGNILATKLLHDHSKESLNIRAAFLHSLQDALFSAGVIVAAVLLLVFNWQWADAGIALVLSLLLVKEAIVLIFETVNILMEGVPNTMDISKLKQELLGVDGVISVSDLHVWNTGSKDIILTAHVVANIKTDQDYADTLKHIQNNVSTNYGVTHITVQLIPVGAQKDLKNICPHCS
jgi:cobalt-zinc-cadmium efflux system protein